MPNTVPNTKSAHFPHNIFENHSKTAKTQNRRTAREEDARQRRQDKGHFPNAPAEVGQPAPFFKGAGARAMKTKTTRTQKITTTRVKLVHSTFHLEPLVRSDMERIAQEKGLSLSQVGNIGWKFYANATLEERYEATLSTQLRQIIREELRAFGHRMIYFLLRIAFAAEHARLLITNVLKVLLQTRGRYDEKHFHTLVNNSAKQAKSNIISNTPQHKSLLEKFWASFSDGQAADQASGSHKQNLADKEAKP
jgi:hypothetical protein